MTGQIDEAFVNITEDTCLLVWRIEQFKVVPWKDIGYFYTGDAYIVLHGYTVGQSKRVIHDIYFWLGSECTQDESGTAAIKAIELDDRFGGEPTQHREVQYHESDAFHKVFEPHGGVRYMAGGIDSGFTSIKFDTNTLLYQIKGRRNPVLQQVPATGTSLNQGDVFIVHSPTNFFLWIGKNANIFEKNKAVQTLDALKAQFPKLKPVRLDDGETTPEFWAALGGETPIASAEEGGADEVHEKTHVRIIHKVEGEAFTKVAEGVAATKDVLTNNAMFIVSRGNQIIVYIGGDVPKEQGKQAIKVAVKFIQVNGLPNWCPISVVRAGTASSELTIIFA